MEELLDEFDLSMLNDSFDPVFATRNPSDSCSVGSASDGESLYGRSAVPSPALSDDDANSTTFGFVNDQDLLSLSVKDLNNLVKRLPKDAIRAIKKRRRTLKNRGYAYSCRQKRLEEKSKLEVSKGRLEQGYAAMEQQLQKVSAERDHYKRQYENLLRFFARGSTVN